MGTQKDERKTTLFLDLKKLSFSKSDIENALNTVLANVKEKQVFNFNLAFKKAKKDKSRDLKIKSIKQNIRKLTAHKESAEKDANYKAVISY